jgi:hypothetical protein
MKVSRQPIDPTIGDLVVLKPDTVLYNSKKSNSRGTQLDRSCFRSNPDKHEFAVVISNHSSLSSLLFMILTANYGIKYVWAQDVQYVQRIK